MSANTFKKLAKIDKRYKYAVYGWIREAEHQLQLINVPLMISSICLLYYYEEELFNILEKDIQISTDKKCITKIRNHRSWSNNSYGINTLDSDSDIVYQWDLKIMKSHSSYIHIGISSKIQPNLYWRIDNTQCAGSKSYMVWEMGLSCCHSSVEWSKNGIEFGEGNIVSIILDLSKAEMRIALDGEDKGVVFRNIDKGRDIKYRLAVSLYGQDDSVRILNFKSGEK